MRRMVYGEKILYMVGRHPQFHELARRTQGQAGQDAARYAGAERAAEGDAAEDGEGGAPRASKRLHVAHTGIIALGGEGIAAAVAEAAKR